MTYRNQDITEGWYEGNHKIIRVTVYDKQGNLKDLSGSEITYVIMDRDDYDVIHIMKSSYNGDSEIKVTGLGTCEVYITHSDTRNLHGTFRHHLNVIDSNGHEETVLTGLVRIYETTAQLRPRKVGVASYLEGKL